MWSAALPCRRAGLVLLGSILAAAVGVRRAVGLRSACRHASGQVWALALPNSVKTVQQRQLDWLASNGVTTLVAFGRTQTSLQRLAVAAKRSQLTVIAPSSSPSQEGLFVRVGTRSCAALRPLGTPAAAVRLARRGLVDYVVIRVRTPAQLRMLRGSRAKRTRIVAFSLSARRRPRGRPGGPASPTPPPTRHSTSASVPRPQPGSAQRLPRSASARTGCCGGRAGGAHRPARHRRARARRSHFAGPRLRARSPATASTRTARSSSTSTPSRSR